MLHAGSCGGETHPKTLGVESGWTSGRRGLEADGCEPLSHEVPPWPSRKEAGIFGVSIFLLVIRLLAVAIYREPDHLPSCATYLSIWQTKMNHTLSGNARWQGQSGEDCATV
jgi:hypothetical protein